MNKRKLVILNQQYLPEVASTGQVFHTIAKYMVQNGWDVTVAAGRPYYPGLQQKRLPRESTIDGVRVKRLWCTSLSKKNPLGRILNLFSFQLSLLFFCLSLSADQTVLVGTAPPFGVSCAGIARRIKKYKLVFTVQDLYPDAIAAAGMMSPQSFAYKSMEKRMRKAIARCDLVQTISTDMSAHLKSVYGANDVRLIYNVSPQQIQPVDNAAMKQKKGYSGKLIIQYSGNFGVAHEYKTLLDTVRILKNDPDILFQISGSGSNYEKLQQCCLSEGLKNIIFEGYAPLDQLEDHLGLADLSLVIFDSSFKNILLPSKYYGILASGRGVLLISGSENDISRDIKNTGCGCVFNHGESENLAKKLRDFAKNPDLVLHMGLRSRSLYDEKYDTNAKLLPAWKTLLDSAGSINKNNQSKH